jgi:hypothetical protein
MRTNRLGSASGACNLSAVLYLSRRCAVTRRRSKLSLAYDRSAGVVRWTINDHEAARVDRIGCPSPDATMLIDRGGTPQPAAPRQLTCGMALFTLMDGRQPRSGTGLVRLGGSYAFPTGFVEGPTLFGQGAEMRVRNFEVRRSAAGSGDGGGGVG